MRDPFQTGISHSFLHSNCLFFTYLSFTSRVSLIVFKALYVILLPISFSFDTYICMFSHRDLHRSTRVGRTVYYCDTISSPKCDNHITRVERWRYRWDNMIIPIERLENIGSFASKRAVNNNFLIYEITYLTSSYKNKNIINGII